ncbi:acetylglutamate kinase [Sulfurimonas sp.]|uniref:acetylglutamate kinase n=1 Tax=Sulfurimonas sp. TaxID=2022749 RepID=UPI002634C361|nr:acetylglutamate kinase [Sulfurimonas sp.]
MKQKINQVRVLLDALPYIKRYANQIFVIKYGGSAQITPELKEKFARDIVLMYLVGIKPVVIHGGGRAIGDMLERLKIGSHFIDGLRVTDEKVMEVVEMVLSGSINKEITALLNEYGAKAIGISGKDASMLEAKPIDMQKYGYVGELTKVDPQVINKLIAEKFIPVIAPVASSNENGHPGFNINADIAAGHIAASLKARKIIFMTDTPGVMNSEKEIIHTLNEEQIKTLKANGVIDGGMIPKVDACLDAVNGGVMKAHIIDGRIEHALLLEIFTSEGVGTVIKS